MSGLNATVLDAPSVTDLNFDELNVAQPISPLELKTIILSAMDSGRIISQIFPHPVKLSPLQTQILVLLFKTGGMPISDLKVALGYSPGITTHTVDTAIYQLRRTFGREIIKNDNGVYKIGKL